MTTDVCQNTPNDVPHMVRLMDQFRLLNDIAEKQLLQIKANLESLVKSKPDNNQTEPTNDHVAESVVDEFENQLTRLRFLNDKLHNIYNHLREVI